MRSSLVLLLASTLLATLPACTCASSVEVSGTGGGNDGGARSDGGAGGGGGATGGGTGGTFTGTLIISPRDVTVDIGPALPPGTVTFSATGDGAPVAPNWSVAPSSLGSIAGNGQFTAKPLVAGLATITARYGTAVDTTKVRVRLHLLQNGSTDGGSLDGGAGGLGGVGGEGVGAGVSPAVLAVLQSTPVAQPGLSLLYPYDGTVWPRGILAPLLQWKPGAQSAQAVGIHLECPNLTWDGAFAQTATPFVRHPIPQAAWAQLTEACSDSTVQLRLVVASGPVAYGPLTASWRIAPGFLKGVVYYNSYGSKLAYNYTGAIGGNGQFGGATLAVRGSSFEPELVAGKTGPVSDCRVCHIVSSDGSTLLTQHGDNTSATSAYALKAANAETVLTPGDGRYAWGALSPDGKLLFSNAAPLPGASLAASALFSIPSGTGITTTGLPAGLMAATPSFSIDGTQVAFNWYGGAGGTGMGDRRSLARMRFTPPGTFADFKTLYTPTGTQTALYPSFLPSGKSIVFQVETVWNGREFAETRSGCDSSGPCSSIGARGELWVVDTATQVSRRLDRLNGKGYLPVGPDSHDDDATLNYEPTVGPIPSGGYAWVIFTSRRLYGSVATLNPWWSDPRFHDLSQAPTPKKLWVAAIDLDAPAGADPSHPAFYLPAQELLAGNSRGYWTPDPCRMDGQACASGDQCCGGFCRGPDELSMVCGNTDGGCSKEFERCTTIDDCCDKAIDTICENSRCVRLIIK